MIGETVGSPGVGVVVGGLVVAGGRGAEVGAGLVAMLVGGATVVATTANVVGEVLDVDVDVVEADTIDVADVDVVGSVVDESADSAEGESCPVDVKLNTITPSATASTRSA